MARLYHIFREEEIGEFGFGDWGIGGLGLGNWDIGEVGLGYQEIGGLGFLSICIFRQEKGVH